MSLPAISAANLTYDHDPRNLIITTDISTGDIIFTSERHGISPKVLGSLFAEEADTSTSSRPSIRVYEVDSEGNEVRTILKRKRTFFFFCMADGTDLPTRITTSTDGATQAAEVVAYLNDVFQKTAATTPLTLDFGPSDTLDAKLDGTSTTVLFSNGRFHAVNSIKAFETASGLINIRDFSGTNDLMRNIRHANVTIAGEDAGLTAAAAVNSLNSMFQLSAVGSGRVPVIAFYQEDVATITANTQEGVAPATGIIQADPANADGHGARLWSNEKISNPGEEYIVKVTGEGDFLIGLTLESSTSHTEFDDLASNDSSLAHSSGITWGHMFQQGSNYIEPHQNYGTMTGVIQGLGWTSNDKLELMRYNSEVQDNFTNDDPNLFKIGINADSKIELHYYDAGRTNDYVLIARSSNSVSLSDGYHLVVKLVDGDVRVLETPNIFTVAEENAAGLTYYFIESPDGSYDSPLFNSTQQAAQADLNAGGAGTYTSRVYVDDPTGTTWYAPTTGFTEDATSAPLNTTTVTYNRIATEADALHAPSALTLQDYTVNEGDSLNIQAQAAGQVPVVAITGLPAGLTAIGGNITGNAPFVSGDTSTNPSDVHTITATRSNEYGSTVQTFDITVNNVTAPTTSVSGFGTPTGPQSGTVLGDTDNVSSSSVELNETLDVGKRFIVTQAWVEANVLPYFDNSEDKVFIGVPKTTATMSTVTLSDFDSVIRLQHISSTSHKSLLWDNDSNDGEVTVASGTDAYYDYAIEWDGTDLHLIACNINDINTQPAVSNGGSFGRVITHSNFTEQSGSLPLAIAVNEHGQVNLSTTGLSEIDIPYGANDIRVSENSETDARFDVGSGPVTADNITLNAGYTYRFYLNNASIESGDTLTFETLDGVAYTTGVTTVGSHGDYNYYVQFAVPSDVPPIRPVWNGTDLPELVVSGSTYVVSITGITLEGPSANQSGTEIVSTTSGHGWVSIDETLAAGERLVLDGAFFADLLAETPNNYDIAIGLKGDNWANTQYTSGSNSITTGMFKGDAYLNIRKSTTSTTYWQIFTPYGSSNAMLTNSSSLVGTVGAFIEVTGSGNNIRLAFGRNGSNGFVTGDESTVRYGDWTSYKAQTGEQGYGITNLDVMVGINAVFSATTFDGDEVDWTGLSEVSIPSAAAALTTDWDKALDFSGSSERLEQRLSGTFYSPIMMSALSSTASSGNSGSASGDINARPWITSIVFSSDNNSSNQHIWNCGEGSGSVDDNIYLRVDASRNLRFGWGRTGALNECHLGALSSTSGTWYGVYIGHTGERLSGGHSASEISDCFDIRIVNLVTGVVGSNLSTSSNWTAGSYGGRMDREVSGDTTIGGRGSNRNFHGKIAAMSVATLRRSQLMPVDAEISMMTRDPKQWLTDYRVGVSWRPPNQAGNYSSWQMNSYSEGYAAQVFLMGDGSGDQYAQIRNQSNWGDYQVTLMDMVSMASSDIVTVNINGLT